MSSVLLLLLFLYPIWGTAAFGAVCSKISVSGKPRQRIGTALAAATIGTLLFTPVVWGPPEGFSFIVPWVAGIIDAEHARRISWVTPTCVFLAGFCVSYLSGSFQAKTKDDATSSLASKVNEVTVSTLNSVRTNLPNSFQCPSCEQNIQVISTSDSPVGTRTVSLKCKCGACNGKYSI